MNDNFKAPTVREADLLAQQVAADLYEPTPRQILECRQYIQYLASVNTTPPAWLTKIWEHVWTMITDQKQHVFAANPPASLRRVLRTFQLLAVNPMLPIDKVAKVLENYPELGLRNPVVILLLVENPSWLMPYITGTDTSGARWSSFAKKRLLQCQPRELVRALLGAPYVDLELPVELRRDPLAVPRVRIWKALELWEIAYADENDPQTFVGLWEADLLTAFEPYMMEKNWTDRQKMDFFKGPITWMRQRQPDYIPPEPAPVTPEAPTA